jgi:hypothetical protein
MDQESRIYAALKGLESGQYKSIYAAAKAINILYSTLFYWQKRGKANYKAIKINKHGILVLLYISLIILYF